MIHIKLSNIQNLNMKLNHDKRQKILNINNTLKTTKKSLRLVWKSINLKKTGLFEISFF